MSCHAGQIVWTQIIGGYDDPQAEPVKQETQDFKIPRFRVFVSLLSLLLIGGVYEQNRGHSDRKKFEDVSAARQRAENFLTIFKLLVFEKNSISRNELPAWPWGP